MRTSNSSNTSCANCTSYTLNSLRTNHRNTGRPDFGSFRAKYLVAGSVNVEVAVNTFNRWVNCTIMDGLAIEAVNAVRPIGAVSTGCAGIAGYSNRTDGTSYALVTLGSRSANGTGGSIKTSYALNTLDSLRTDQCNTSRPDTGSSRAKDLVAGTVNIEVAVKALNCRVNGTIQNSFAVETVCAIGTVSTGCADITGQAS